MSEVPDWMIDQSNEIPECQSCENAAKDYEELEKVADDLTYLIKRLVQELRKSDENSKLCAAAIDFLKRRKLTKINLSRKADAD
jgi:hypothetical protein